MQRDVYVDTDRTWIWRRMENISCLDKVTNEEVLGRVNEGRQILKSILQEKHQ